LFKSIKKLVILVILAFVIYTAVQLMNFLFPVRYNETAEKYAGVNNMDVSIVYAIINAESRFDSNAVSNKGAEGLMQLKKDTALWCLEKMGEPAKDVNLRDPETNIKIGTWYFSYLKNKLESEDLAIIAYNAGISNVNRWLDEGLVDEFVTNPDTIPYPETKKYIKKVRFYKRIYTEIKKVTIFTDKIKMSGGII